MFWGLRIATSGFLLSRGALAVVVLQLPTISVNVCGGPHSLPQPDQRIPRNTVSTFYFIKEFIYLFDTERL